MTPPRTLRSRLTLWYVGVLAVLLLVYAALVFAFQYAVLTRQIVHDEVQDVETVEGLLFFDQHGELLLRQDYYSRPQSHLLIDRLMEVRDLSGTVLYRSPTLQDMPLGGPNRNGEGEADFDQRFVRLQDGTHVLMISHIHPLQGRIVLIRLGYSLVPLRARMIQFLATLLIAVPLALLLAALAGQTIAKRALKPLELMATRAEGITASNLHQRLEVRNAHDELGQMARVFNHLLDRLEQAFSQLQRFTADAAHELRTPLASLRTIGEVAIQQSHSPEEYRDALSSILEETARLNGTIESLLLLARAEAAQPGSGQSTFPVRDVMDEILKLFEIVMEERSITVLQENGGGESTRIHADRAQIRIALLNVLHNSLKFSPPHSTLRIAYREIEGASPMLQISIQDQGPGIPKGEHQKVFERFFTSSAGATANHSGTGLGLSIAKLVVDRSGGSIAFDPEVREGARCVLVLPRTL